MRQTANFLDIDEAAIRSVLDEIKDPCSCVAGAPAGLSEMGLVMDVQIASDEEGVTVRAVLTATEPTCAFAAMFVDEAKKRIEEIPGVVLAIVEFQPTVDWSEMDISPSYRKRLNAVRQQRRMNAGLASPTQRIA